MKILDTNNLGDYTDGFNADAPLTSSLCVSPILFNQTEVRRMVTKTDREVWGPAFTMTDDEWWAARDELKREEKEAEGHGVSDKDLFCACAVVGSIVGVMVMIAIAMWRAL
jgi:hypothetical protein